MSKINVMVNGIPGKMAALVANAIVKSSDFDLVPSSLTGPEITEKLHVIEDPKGVSLNNKIIDLILPDQREEEIVKLLNRVSPFLTVDYTSPSAVNANAEFYCSHGLPFVMGTTGGDRQALEAVVQNSQISAVIARNMAKPIVALQAFIEEFTSMHLNQMEGYDLKIVESHQSAKLDVSGTAKAFAAYFRLMGINFDDAEIKSVRNPEEQLAIGIPEMYLSAHGWHSYTLTTPKTNDHALRALQKEFEIKFFAQGKNRALKDYSGIVHPSYMCAQSLDKNVILFVHAESDIEKAELNLVHNINGRSVYVDCTLDALNFLRNRLAEDKKGFVYSMIDVIKSS